MTINGKTLRQIFEEMRWQEKVIVVAGSLFILYSVIYLVFLTGRIITEDDKTPAPVVFRGAEKSLSQLDPSLTDDDGKTAVMAFTTVWPDEKGKGFRTTISLAQSQPPCKDWRRLNFTGFPDRREELMGPDGVTPVKTGTWRVETPSIVHDPEDSDRAWKMFAYKYFWSDDESKALARYYGMIVYSYASSLSGPWSTEEWMFSASADTPPYPYNQLVHAHLNDLDPSLSDIYFYARPSVIRLGDALVMSLSAYIRGRETPDRIVMIASHDHGKSWQYLGTPLRYADIARMGDYSTIWGASLIERKGTPYLALVLGNKEKSGTGTLIAGFENISAALLKKDAKTGAPEIFRAVPPSSLVPSRLGGGIAAYSDSCKSGLVTSEYSDIAKGYRIFKTYAEPVE